MVNLPEPHFIDRDGEVILAETVARFEQLAGRPLEPSQVERLIVDLIAYRETLVRVAVQEAAKQNLVAYAHYPMIDLLGQLVALARLPSAPAQVTLRFALPAPLGVDSPVPALTRVRSNDSKVEFETDEDATILAGQTEVSVAATCRTTGPLGNGYVAGQVTKLVSQLPFTVTVTNTTTSSSGTSSEGTEALRSRFPLAFQGQSVAGPEAAYERIARGASVDILSVAVSRPTPGTVRITVLSPTDPEPAPLLALVLQAASDKTVRPLTDTVEVVGTVRVTYSVNCDLVLYQGTDEDSAIDLATQAIDTYVAQLAASHGRSPVPDRITSLARVPGVYSAALSGPALPVVQSDESAQCTGVTVSVTGTTEEPSP